MHTIDDADRARFIKAQIKRINLEKWYEGERIKSDPGANYVHAWIQSNAECFREAWNNSCCRQCNYCESCGHEIRTHCERFSSYI